jgi:hypothetical protein
MTSSSDLKRFHLMMERDGRDPIVYNLNDLQPECKHYFHHVLGVPMFQDDSVLMQLTLLRNNIEQNGFATKPFRTSHASIGRVKNVLLWDAAAKQTMQHAEWGVPVVPSKLTVALPTTSATEQSSQKPVVWTRRFKPMFKHLLDHVDQLEKHMKVYADVFFFLKRISITMDQLWNNRKANMKAAQAATKIDGGSGGISGDDEKRQYSQQQSSTALLQEVRKQTVEHDLKLFQFTGAGPLMAFSADVLRQCMDISQSSLASTTNQFAQEPIQVSNRTCMPGDVSQRILVNAQKGLRASQPILETMEVTQFFTDVIREYIESATNEKLSAASLLQAKQSS